MCAASKAKEYSSETHLRRQFGEILDFSWPLLVDCVVEEQLPVIFSQSGKFPEQVDVEVVYFSEFVHYVRIFVQKYSKLSKKTTILYCLTFLNILYPIAATVMLISGLIRLKKQYGR